MLDTFRRAMRRHDQEIEKAQGANQNIRDAADPKVLTRKAAAEDVEFDQAI